MKTTTVIDYIVQRIEDKGVERCFGVPGDYAFPVGDAFDSNPNIKWNRCSNELNAAYADDGVKTHGALLSNIAVGFTMLSPLICLIAAYLWAWIVA